MRTPRHFVPMLSLFLGLFLLGGLPVSSTIQAASARDAIERVPPRPLREFRGAWIATVANLDWPSKPGLTTEQQQSELTALFDRAVQLKLNVLILQVRPSCDAFYSSKFEPWSEFLTGQMGRGPSPYYDPLAFAIEQAHRRGLELHAWFNPFRVRVPNPKTGSATNYVLHTRPEWVRRYGSQHWLDPGLKEVQEYSMKIIMDVVTRYDIDGVHLDDYFYPYPEKGANGQWLEFPDEATWKQRRAAGGTLNRADWRRRNIDDFVATLNRRIKAEKKWVKFGISPFGIWRPGFPKQIKGLDAYERLFADSRKWLMNGWADYFAPQLYWDIQGPDHSYSALLDWWASQNSKSRLICPGNDVTKVGNTWPSSEIANQIGQTRRTRGTSGNILWNMSSLLQNNGRIGDVLARDLYAVPALPPATPWLQQKSLPKPKLELVSDSGLRQWKAIWSVPDSEPVWLWYYQARVNGKWISTIYPDARTGALLPNRESTSFPDLIAVTPIGRCGEAGPTAVVDTHKVLGLLTQAAK